MLTIAEVNNDSHYLSVCNRYNHSSRSTSVCQASQPETPSLRKVCPARQGVSRRADHIALGKFDEKRTSGQLWVKSRGSPGSRVNMLLKPLLADSSRFTNASN